MMSDRSNCNILSHILTSFESLELLPFEKFVLNRYDIVYILKLSWFRLFCHFLCQFELAG